MEIALLSDDVLILIFVFVFDRGGFWQLNNTVAQFRGNSLPFTYFGTLYPRIVLLIMGYVLFVLGNVSQDHRALLMFGGMLLMTISHLCLYVKAVRSR